jgi:2,4-dienoyl-CoA reductase-like NADH-dependent reductase (Old Yellow Enzyme family)
MSKAVASSSNGCTIVVDGKGPVPAPVPEAMSEADIEHTLTQYAHSAELAIEAGFEGIELHAANGYLIEQLVGEAPVAVVVLDVKLVGASDDPADAVVTT